MGGMSRFRGGQDRRSLEFRLQALVRDLENLKGRNGGATRVVVRNRAVGTSESLADHERAADPHPQYILETDAETILALLLTVDGVGSGIDADLVDGEQGAHYLARANHTGTQGHDTIGDFDAGVQTNRLDQLAAPTAAVSLNGQKATSLADPTSAQDAATKAYVDAARAGLDVKQSVRAASTANIDLATGGALTIDGVALSAGDRVLVKDQTTGSENGIYEVAAGAWARAGDADEDAEVTAGMFVFAEEGTANDDTGWVLSTNDPITVGTTALDFVQFSGPGTSTLSRHTATIGDGVATSIQVTHGLGNQDVLVQVREVSTDEVILADVTLDDANNATIGFASAPASNSIRVVVIG